ncbi:magnesium transporter [Hazenella coriacea]|uniref:Magnesium transporter MgtE n=1 Tax=Hazenella coriacea TaxID=1179467 RepID=A0A4R3L5U2_9BACL|nr:magnesium transporter [Hazenella coriacea]TCS95019.1 magnesium transporter [Hazenella coriacea]
MTQEQTSIQEWLELSHALQKKDHQKTRQMIDELQPYDLGQLFFRLHDVFRKRFLSILTPIEIGQLLEELNINEQKEVIFALGPVKTVQALNQMSRDKVADLLVELDPVQAQSLLKDMDRSEANKVQELLLYPEKTAGGLMTNEYVRVYEHYTVEQAITYLRQQAPTAETIYYIYVVNQNHQLVGVVSLRELLIASSSAQVNDIMFERVISVPTDLDQEKVAHLLEQYDFLAIPVVDANEKLLGIIMVDDIIDVLIEEAHEDIAHLSAITPGEKEVLTHPFQSVRRRIPWLILLLFIGMITANLLNLFEGTIEVLPVLTLFMPMIAGMTGNTATQSLAIIIRGLASKELHKGNIRKVIRQESMVGMLIGLVCSLFIIVMISIWKHSVELGMVVGASLFFTLLIGTFVGTITPILLNKWNVDPTVASGPLITTLNDVFSLMIYFGLATFFINYLLT